MQGKYPGHRSITDTSAPGTALRLSWYRCQGWRTSCSRHGEGTCQPRFVGQKTRRMWGLPAQPRWLGACGEGRGRGRGRDNTPHGNGIMGSPSLIVLTLNAPTLAFSLPLLRISLSLPSLHYRLPSHLPSPPSSRPPSWPYHPHGDYRRMSRPRAPFSSLFPLPFILSSFFLSLSLLFSLLFRVHSQSSSRPSPTLSPSR